MKYRLLKVNDIDIFYREAGDRKNPTIILLHGFPTSSHMFRNLIKELENEYHLIAPDYPGFGNSEQPSIKDFDYSFDNIALVISDFIEKLKLKDFSLYVHDYGAPIGFRLAIMHPEKIKAIISQNGNVYEEGLLPSWDPIKSYWENPDDAENKKNISGLFQPEFTKYQYFNGTRNIENISPDNWNVDQFVLDREGNKEIQMQLILDYKSNVDAYPTWQKYLRENQPPTLIVWGKNDMFFGPNGAKAFEKDLKNVEVHLLDTGHFPLEEDLEVSVEYIKEFLTKNLNKM